MVGDPTSQDLVQTSALSYANFVRFGMAHQNYLDHTPNPVQLDANTERRIPSNQDRIHLSILELRAEEALPQGSLPPRVPSYMEELIALCLLAKLWGEILPIALIIKKTKVDWKHIKGVVEYIDLENGWVLLRFATMCDKEYVWFNRPWFVKGLNFVLSMWKPYFDPYSATIDRIDQWVRIPHLP